MERSEAPRIPVENITLSEIESFKKGWKSGFRIFGLLTLGAIGYGTIELINEELSTSFSDGMVLIVGTLAARGTLTASSSLRYASSVEAKIVSSKP